MLHETFINRKIKRDQMCESPEIVVVMESIEENRYRYSIDTLVKVSIDLFRSKIKSEQIAANNVVTSRQRNFI